MNRPMELDIWRGDWGLSSVDHDCLEIMAYAKFSGVPLQTRITNNPFRTPMGKLPVFKHGKKILTSYSEIASYLRQKNYSADFGLTPKQCSEVVAYSQFIKEKLCPALQYTWWVHEKNYTELFRPWYGNALPFPLNYYYPGRYEREAKLMMETLFDQHDELADVETIVYREAEKCLTLLSTRLADQDFFFGSHPTSLDATVYAYLAPLFKAPLPYPTLQNYAKGCNNLGRFVVRITQRYFPQSAQEFEAKKSTEDKPKSKTDSDVDFPKRRMNQFFSVLLATVAMAGYAFSKGLVQLKPHNEGLHDHLDDYDMFEHPDNSDN